MFLNYCWKNWEQHIQNIKNSNEEALSMTKKHQWKMLNKYMKYGSTMYKLNNVLKKQKSTIKAE